MADRIKEAYEAKLAKYENASEALKQMLLEEAVMECKFEQWTMN